MSAQYSSLSFAFMLKNKICRFFFVVPKDVVCMCVANNQSYNDNVGNVNNFY